LRSRRAVDIDIEQTVADAAVVDGAVERRKRDAGPEPLRFEAAANSLARSATLPSSLLLARSRHQPPGDGALALDAFLDGAEEVGMVAAHLALVDDAR